MSDAKNEPQGALAAAIARGAQRTIDFRSMGRTGLNITGGYIIEEKMRALQGQRGLETYKEMDTDSTIGLGLSLIERSGRQAEREVQRVSDAPEDIAAADFLESCLDDLDLQFSDTIADQCRGIVQFGFSLHAIQYKRRAGNASEPYLRSRFKDGRIGWRGFTSLGQETITRWLTADDAGNDFAFVEQVAPPTYQREEIPYERLLHVRQSTHKNNPLGTSLLRAAFRDWYLKGRIETFMAIGAERSVAGMPVIRVPPEVLAGLTPEDQAMLEACRKIATGLRVDEDGGIVFPMSRDANGQLQYDIELMSTNSNQLGELLKVITLLDYRIAACLSSEFTKLGESNGATGSYAMHSDKSDLHARMVDNLLSCIAESFNRFAIPRLFALNDFQVDELPRLVFKSVGTTNLKDLGAYLQSCAAAGAVLFPNADAEDALMRLADLPPLPRDDGDAPALPPLGDPNPTEITEVHDGDAHPDEVAEHAKVDAPAGGAQL